MLPRELYDAEATRALDRAAIERHGLPGMELMRRAGAAAFALLRSRWPDARRLLVACGGGNNGGDGFVVARLAAQAGLVADAWLLADPERLRGDARRAFDDWRQAGGQPAGGDLAARAAQADLLVDALFGTGLDRPLAGAALDAVQALAGAGRPLLALDIPSGLAADTGAVLGAAPAAEATITFIGLKVGLLTGAGPAHVGALHFDDLGVPCAVYEQVAARARRADWAGCHGWLGRRRRDAHKGHFGHVLVVGGEHGFAGAARLAAEAAARCGAGLVSVATRERHAAALLAGRPELMVHAVEEPAALAPLLAAASVVAVGPGLGRGAWGRSLLETLLADWHGPLVVDADGLNLLAAGEARRDDWVLTPHPGEAARLLGCDTPVVQADRLAAAEKLAARYGGVALLKGAGTVVAGGGAAPCVCGGGNPGMASGGMGDVLTGVVAALLAQGLAAARAAEMAACLHARAADVAAAQGERGLLAGDLFASLRALLDDA